MGLLPKCYFARNCNCHFRTRDQSACWCGQDTQKHESTDRIADETDSTAKDDWLSQERLNTQERKKPLMLKRQSKSTIGPVEFIDQRHQAHGKASRSRCRHISAACWK